MEGLYDIVFALALPVQKPAFFSLPGLEKSDLPFWPIISKRYATFDDRANRLGAGPKSAFGIRPIVQTALGRSASIVKRFHNRKLLGSWDRSALTHIVKRLERIKKANKTGEESFIENKICYRVVHIVQMIMSS